MAKYKQEDIITLVKAKTGYFKTDLRKVLPAVGESIIEILACAEVDDPVEIKLFDGFVIHAQREAPRPATDPRTGEVIIAREKIRPRVKLKKTFQWNIEKAAGILGGNDDESQEA
jgi:nucleoid DNA-binding protein